MSERSTQYDTAMAVNPASGMQMAPPAQSWSTEENSSSHDSDLGYESALPWTLGDHAFD